MNPFDVFGLEPAFRLDPKSLEERFRELSKVVHPDKHAKGGARERRLALSRAVDVNAAYRILRDPVRRAEALLELRGRPKSEAKASPALLMEVMELREGLGEARARADLAAVRAQRDVVDTRRGRVVDRLAAALESGDAETAESALSELRYLVRFLDEVRAIEEDLGDRPS